MRVVLRLSGDAESADSLKAVTLTEREFVIGRDAGCDWSIADGLRMMSRRHCILQLSGDSVLLTDVSSNGTSLGSPGNKLVQSQPTVLADTETIYLAGEHVRVDFECHREEKPADTDDFWGVDELKRNRGGARQPVHNPADDSLDLLGEDDPDRNNPLSLALDEVKPSSPMSDVLSLDDSPAPRERAAPAPRPEDRVTFDTPSAARSDPSDLFSVEDEDDHDDSDDPFADLGGGPASKPAGGGGLSLEDTPPQSPHAPVPLSLDESPAAPPRHTEDLSLDDAPAAPSRPADPLSLDDIPPPTPRAEPPPAASPAAPPPPAADPPPRTSAHPRTQPPGPLPSHPETQAPALQQRTAPADDHAERALAVLFAALGIQLEEIPRENQQAVAAEIGRSFRALANGMRELLESRRDVKIALGLGATQIETGANPLKFVRDATGAVDAILRPSASGYLSGVAAVEDSVKALQKHQVALVGGVKVSMQTALSAFNPRSLEEKLSKKGLSQIIPMKRKAELWERFVENYAEFAEEADDNIKRLISKDLEKLYADEATRSRAALDL